MASSKLLESLSESDLLLVRSTEPAELTGLDEDDLLELHSRVRRARNKHVGIYRRGGAARVSQKGARGAARGANLRSAARAEVFEEALARVSRQVSAAARDSARSLKEERLALVRAENAAPPAAPARRASARKGASTAKRPARTDTTRNSPGRKKREAGTKATGARRQAKRDSRSRG